MKESILGNTYYVKAGQYLDTSIESSVYMDICRTADEFGGDVEQVIHYLESYYLLNWESRARNMGLSEQGRAYWAKKIIILQEEIKILNKSMHDLLDAKVN